MENYFTTLFMSTFPPRKCGIATFTYDLAHAIENETAITAKIIALNDAENNYDYSHKVLQSIKACNYEDYLDAAEKINSLDEIKCVSIQHEFGIFGGEQSCHPLPFLDKLKKPALVTFHSIFPDPQEEVKQLVGSIAKRVKTIIVMTEIGKKLLQEEYGIITQIEIIPHGIPDVHFENQEIWKKQLGLQDKIVLSSFGMVGPGKGYEYVIEALRSLVNKFPNLVYLIIGATHPFVLNEDGEAYRIFLEKKLKAFGLENTVSFINRYAEAEEIVSYLKASDIYISSSQNPEQITSGTLVNAMGCGRAVISTPFPHARDIVRRNNGLLVDYDKPEKYAEAIHCLLSNPEKRKYFESNNYQDTRHMTWKNVAKEYERIINLQIAQGLCANAKHFNRLWKA